MSSIIIKGMELPKDGSMIFAIRPNGMVEDVMGCYVGKAIPVPPHGRLIDADALQSARDGDCYGCPYTSCMINDYIADAPTIIPAEEEHTMDEFMYGQEGNPNDGSM